MKPKYDVKTLDYMYEEKRQFIKEMKEDSLWDGMELRYLEKLREIYRIPSTVPKQLPTPEPTPTAKVSALEEVMAETEKRIERGPRGIRVVPRKVCGICGGDH